MSDLIVPEPCSDRSEGEGPFDVWLVWDDADYYGPHLKAVCADRRRAFRWVELNVEPRNRVSLFVVGTPYDAPIT